MTRMLSLLGAALPNRLMAPIENNNESGFWEPQPVADLNDEILGALDSDWDDVFAFRPHQYLSNFDRFYAGRAVELLDQEFDGSEVIALKDPRISVLATFWDRALCEAGYKTHYIVMVRNPLEVAESLRARDGFPREKSFLLWSSYMIAVDRDTRHRPRTFISYDQLMSDWRAVRSRIEAEAGVPFRRDTAAAALEIDRYLDRRLRHHTSSSDELFARADVPEQVKSIYQIFASACKGEAIDSAVLEAIETDFSKMDQLVGPLLADLKLSTRALSSELADLKDAHSSTEDHANTLAEQLKNERVEHGRSLAEIESRASVLDGERSRLCSEIEEKQRQFDELLIRIGQAETGATQLAADLEKVRELRILDKLQSEEERAQLQSRLEDQEKQNESIRERLQERELELLGKKTDFEKVTALLAIAESDLAGTRDKLTDRERRIDELGRELDASLSARSELEGRLTAHFDETTALSRLVLEAQRLTESECEKTRRVLELHDAILAQPHWWFLMPHSYRSRLRYARLSRLGVFDAESYLSKNPDVAAAGEDPVHHYIHHGIGEDRPV